MNLCQFCQYRCMNITKANICSKHVEKIGNVTYYFQTRDEVPE